ncbi:sigma-70 family RNA polymerase sigma factor [Leisingera daeponensis]|uniref:RNA polymerase sigma factor n=1 Tax=Leisingera daeponensis TaxID=405746 RepID=A0ABS7NL13_9RHOB|nr:sigma-70 family RNA polymerase sigma factor [Leisingera daeponensis]MBY6141897.1 sigma-70 family RNA polymerase sigma factor [Leisingera daeponensis]
MLTLNMDSPPGEDTVLRASPEGRAVVSEDQTFSQLTVWLLAVRDHRDREAFGDMFDFLAPRLKGFVIRCGARPALAEEIVQDVMLTIWRKAALFDPHKAQASAWIYQIARNRHIDIIRKERRPVPDELAEDPGTEPDASQVLALEQETLHLKQAIARLQPDQREMIEKAYIGDLTHQEISARTGLPLGTVKSRIRLGLGRLRKELKGLR